MECFNAIAKSCRWYVHDTMITVLYRMSNYRNKKRLFSATMNGEYSKIMKHVCRIFFMDVVLVN
jgi:hypothetical protein